MNQHALHGSVWLQAESLFLQHASSPHSSVLLKKDRHGGARGWRARRKQTVLHEVVQHLKAACLKRRDPFIAVAQLRTVDALPQAADEGRLLEVFGAGTACLAQPVDVLLRANGEHIRVKADTPASEQVRPQETLGLSGLPVSRCKDTWLLAGCGPADMSSSSGSPSSCHRKSLADRHQLALMQVVTRILREIVDIQYGRRKDHPWSVPFETAAQK